jgi:putative NADH-flavin reductase
MQITVFGANGKVGAYVVRELLDKGYVVIAFIHGSHQFRANPKLKIIEGDIYSAKDVNKALVGSKIVISTLGSWGTPKQDILSEGMKNIIPAMKDIGITRIVSLTGADARAEGDTISVLHWLGRQSLRMIAPKVLHDGEEHIRLLQESSLDWTVLRSPIMNERGVAAYKVANSRPKPWQTINRRAVAKAMVEQLEDNTSAQDCPYISRK